MSSFRAKGLKLFEYYTVFLGDLLKKLWVEKNALIFKGQRVQETSCSLKYFSKFWSH